MQGLRSNFALFWAPEKPDAGEPLLMFLPRFSLGTLANAAVT